jgi:hypothetical protein
MRAMLTAWLAFWGGQVANDIEREGSVGEFLRRKGRIMVIQFGDYGIWVVVCRIL